LLRPQQREVEGDLAAERVAHHIHGLVTDDGCQPGGE
jgi:hypothetical protein